MSSGERMHVTRPKSSKGRSRPMITNSSMIYTPSQPSALSPQPPAAAKTKDKSNQSLRSRAILRRSSQPTTDILTEAYDRPPEEPVSLNRYRVLPSIEKKTSTDNQKCSQCVSRHRKCQHTNARLDVVSDSTPPEESDLLLAIRTPCGQRFKRSFRPSDQLKGVLSAAEAEFGDRFDNCIIETMDVPRRTFSNLTMTLAQCGVLNKSVLCISHDDSEMDLT
nr:UBX domain-containing protein 10 isoform X1 [Danio rerio]XP_009295338.1 UBX domain-containing protein 10 isoform X1 [Danio rerio]|eukprot:XP_009295336.1 UBX domain-containing protein 10 isoform X1 [Danio rerio]